MATAIENHIQSLRARFQGSQLFVFFRWWAAELGQLLPARWQARMQHARRRLVMRVAGPDLVIAVHDADRVHEVDRFSLDQDVSMQRQQIRDLLVEQELAEVARDLLLPEGRVLIKELLMPIAAEANLRQALAFEMDRQTPFAAEDVYFDYRLLGRDKDAGQLRVEMLASLREPLEREIALLAPRGMAPTGVDVDIEGRPAGVNLLPPARRFRMVNRRARMHLALAGAAAGLLVLVMAQSIWLRQHQISEVQAAIEEVREEALRVRQIKEQISDASEAAGFMRAQREADVHTVKVLAEVTRIMPDDTYLDRLLIGEGNVQMQGKSANAQQLIELVNQSALFSDAAFRGPTRLDTRSQTEIFDLTATLAGGGS
jgi:general secretion pathway protein L